MRYRRMVIEVESPEQLGYDSIDCNLSESSVSDQRLSDLRLGLDIEDLLLQYGDHRGDPFLREQVAMGGDGLSPDDVLVTPGAAAALFFLASSQLERDDHMVVVRSNYATNIETPRTIGAAMSFIDLRFEDGYRLDLDRLADSIGEKTKLVSLTFPHNPTGVTLAVTELEAVIEMVEASDATLLVDETYRELSSGALAPMAASLSDRAVSIASVSKAYGLPGLRGGWAVTRNACLQEELLAAKEQIVICGATIDEAIAGHVLAARHRILPPILERVEAHRAITAGWIEGEWRMEWVAPTGGVVCFPRIRAEVDLDLDRFYHVLLADYRTYVGPGHWFEQDRRHMRIGYGWPTEADLRRGLANVSSALDLAAR